MATIGKLTLRGLAKALFQAFTLTADEPVGFTATGALQNISRLTTDGSNAALPTADPEVDGALWNNAGTVKVSAGPPP